MGVSLSWIAVEAKTADAVQTALGVVETGEAGWDYYDFPMAGRLLENGWYLVTAEGDEDPILSDEVLSKLSLGTSVAACSIEEHCMYQSAMFWRDGRKIWSVQHRGGNYRVMDLVVDGALPDNFAELRQRRFDEQAAAGGEDAGVDYIADIPLDLAESIVDFRHEYGGTDEFQALRRIG